MHRGASLRLSEFRSRVELLEGREYDDRRTRFINAFVDVDTAYFRDRIAQTTQFRDGRFPTGYLWETLRHAPLILEEQIEAGLPLLGPLYVLWDPLSSDQVVVEGYWTFPRFAALSSHGPDVAAGLAFLPDDIYIFDHTYGWTFIFTHEHLEDMTRMCFTATP